MVDALLQIAGWLLVLLGLADLFVTVVYSRSDVGLLSPWLNRGIWAAFRTVGRAMPDGSGRRRRRWLTFAGPFMLVATLAMWLVLLLIGFALVCWPALGDGVRKSSGDTPTDFATAVYYSGYTLATLGFGDLVPATGTWRVLAVVEALLGFSVLTLSLTYFMSVYSALVRRNALGLALHHRTAGTDDAAELLARLGAGGRFSDTASTLGTMNLALFDLYESHHSYPILHYFRDVEPYKGVVHMAGLTAAVAALARTALDRHEHRAFVESVEMTEADHGSRFLLEHLAGLLLPPRYRPDDVSGTPGRAERERLWGGDYDRALQRLRDAGITSTMDPAAGRARYVELRRRWQPHVDAFSHYMLADMSARGGR